MKRSLPNRSDSVGTSVSRFLFSRAQAALAPCIALMLPWQLSRVELLRGPWAQPANQMPKSPMANSLIRVFTIMFSPLCSVCVHSQVTTPVRFGSCRLTLQITDDAPVALKMKSERHRGGRCICIVSSLCAQSSQTPLTIRNPKGPA